MSVRLLIAFVAALWIGVCPISGIAAEKKAANVRPVAADHYESQVRPVLMRVCADCHHPEDDSAPAPFLKSLTRDDVTRHRSLWSSVAEQLTNRTMPPPDELQPSEAERLEVAEWIETTLRESACDLGPYAGPIVTRRLNRVEYDNTLRDLLGVDLHASEAFPVDGSGGEGFDNNGETLFLSELLLERYLQAATEALDAAVIAPAFERTFTSEDFLGAGVQREGATTRVPAEKAAHLLVPIYRDGDYRVDLRSLATSAKSANVTLKLDGLAVEQFRLGIEFESGKENRSATARLTRGVHRLTLRATSGAEITLASLRLSESRKQPSAEQLANHERIMGLAPTDAPERPGARAERILRTFLRRAFRHPVSDADVQQYFALYERGIGRGDPWTEAVKLALRGVLVSPRFLFRIEASAASAEPQPIDDHDLAVRLSYFLWSTMPDAELDRLADAGRLSDPAVLSAQVDRMLADPKAAAFAEQFIGQWLGTRDVGARAAPDTNAFKGEFTTELLLDMRDEPVWFFQHLVSENRSLIELLDSDYSLLTPRLAQHYGVTGDGPIKAGGNGWTSQPSKKRTMPPRVMTFNDERRGGLLGMGGVHLLTSYPNRTSPVLRGGWILETLLGVHVPAPPPDVPELKRGKSAKVSLKEQFAKHREHASCAACHNLIDPLGFSLENFDVLGRWREKDGKFPIDASATTPAGESFTGPAGLRTTLLSRKDDFRRQLTRKMLGFALGRSLVDADDCTVQQISDAVADDEDRIRALIHEVVLSTPFRMSQRVADDATQPTPQE